MGKEISACDLLTLKNTGAISNFHNDQRNLRFFWTLNKDKYQCNDQHNP